jgi:hypothetical protein
MLDYTYKKYNNLLGWISFLVALVVYTLTVEPTVSFWDCGEYIATSAKLELGHPPGAPLFQMIGAIFAMFALEKTQIALMVNMMSVLSSAFTILFLFWSTTLLLKNTLKNHIEISKQTEWAILGSAFIAALSFTFTDSFWYNAVEAEVYAMAVVFIALLLWMGLKWQERMFEPTGNRWLLAIALVSGLSFGVHIMALLVIPTIGMLYFFKHYTNVNWKNFIIANIISVGALMLVFKIVVPFTLELFGRGEIFLVNSLGLPFGWGTIVVFLLYLLVFIWGIHFTQKKNYIHANTAVLSIMFVVIGFSCWMMLPIRSNALPPINENRPSDAVEMLNYYNREQYGSNSLTYGPQFTDMFAGLDEENPYSDINKNYDRDPKTGKYIVVNHWKNAKPNPNSEHCSLLPRLWSSEHAENYLNWTGPLDFRIDPNYGYERELMEIGVDFENLTEEEYYEIVGKIRQDTEKTITQFRAAYSSGRLDNEDFMSFIKSYKNRLIIEKPSFASNIYYMLDFQFGYMYMRYLFWNFVGRQSDKQGQGSNNEGNWLSGISFVDNAIVGPQNNLYDDAKNNKGRNTYFFLPFILALIGVFFHSKKDWKSFYAIGLLFLFTGLILKIYLNERPYEPRERDYAVVGSFYVFAIWIGFGVYAIYDFFLKWLNPKVALPLVLTTTFLASPLLLATQNWDDHDRKHRDSALVNAKTYLDSCDKNAIIYTIGDNDTFPLWYAQEIEDYRTDVRICNTQLIFTDWYIDDMKRQAYESKPLPISFDNSRVKGDELEQVPYRALTENRWELKDLIGFIKSEDENTKVKMGNDLMLDFFPTQKVRLTVDKAAVIKNKVVNPKYYDSIVPYIDFEIKTTTLTKNRLIMLDILANNNWERPIHFTGGSFGDDDFMWLKDYLQLQGMVYKLVPIKTPVKEDASPLDMGMIDTDKMYDIIMKWDWGNSNHPDIYYDSETRKNSITYRSNAGRLIEALIVEGKKDKALKVIDLLVEKLPLEYYEHYSTIDPFIIGYYEVGQPEKARKLADKLIKKYSNEIAYYQAQDLDFQNVQFYEIARSLSYFKNVVNIFKGAEDQPYYNKYKQIYKQKYRAFSPRLGLKDAGLKEDI